MYRIKISMQPLYFKKKVHNHYKKNLTNKKTSGSFDKWRPTSHSPSQESSSSSPVVVSTSGRGGSLNCLLRVSITSFNIRLYVGSVAACHLSVVSIMNCVICSSKRLLSSGLIREGASDWTSWDLLALPLAIRIAAFCPIGRRRQEDD